MYSGCDSFPFSFHDLHEIYVYELAGSDSCIVYTMLLQSMSMNIKLNCAVLTHMHVQCKINYCIILQAIIIGTTKLSI